MLQRYYNFKIGFIYRFNTFIFYTLDDKIKIKLTGVRGVEKYAWKARVAEGKTEEYRRRHNEIWDEMVREFAITLSGFRAMSFSDITNVKKALNTP